MLSGRPGSCHAGGMPGEKRFVYVIRSESDAARHYTGLTGELAGRLRWHNGSASGYGVRYLPWTLIVAITFRTETTARRFETYLKSGSGRAFSKSHFQLF